LTTLDVSNNTLLSQFDCSNNSLSSLDVSQNTALTRFDCSNNLITMLDLNQNPSLRRLDCSNNLLTELKIQSGVSYPLEEFSALNNLNLQCIEVDTVATAQTYLTNGVDTGVIFSLDCNYTNVERISDITFAANVFPNPSMGRITINLGNEVHNNLNVEIRNVLGQLVFSKTTDAVNTLDLDLDLDNGLYWLLLESEKGRSRMQIQKI
jgi:hypothetical protein